VRYWSWHYFHFLLWSAHWLILFMPLLHDLSLTLTIANLYNAVQVDYTFWIIFWLCLPCSTPTSCPVMGTLHTPSIIPHDSLQICVSVVVTTDAIDISKEPTELISKSWQVGKGIWDPFKRWQTANQTMSKSAERYGWLQLSNCRLDKIQSRWVSDTCVTYWCVRNTTMYFPVYIEKSWNQGYTL
jgi:hypothetical protein